MLVLGKERRGETPRGHDPQTIRAIWKRRRVIKSADIGR